MLGIAAYVKEGLPFVQGVSLGNFVDSYLCFPLALFHSVSQFVLLYQSFSLSLCTFSNAISSNIDEVLLINPSANMFVFRYVHHKDVLTYSGGTDRPGENTYNITQMVNLPTWIAECSSRSPALLNLFLYSHAICFTMDPCPFGKF